MLTIDNKDIDTSPPEPFFDNNYSEQITKESDDLPIEKFHPGPHYDVHWTILGKETVRVVFSLFSITNSSNETRSSNNKTHDKINIYPNMVSIPSRSLRSIDGLKYYRFTIRQYRTNTDKVLEMQKLIVKNISTRNYDHLSNSLLLNRLNPKEKYSICIYYYQTNVSTETPDLYICQDIKHDHLKPSVHGLLFILTQYSIILGMLVVLQGLFSMRKRRLAHIVHQHLINKTQRIRSRLSSISLVRQSFSSMDGTTEQTYHTMTDRAFHEEHKLTKRVISSPAIVFTEPSVLSHNYTEGFGANEPFRRFAPAKNHVHFLLGLNEGSDDNDSGDIQIDTKLNQQVPSFLSEPYGDRPDALLSMAHILDTNKPWCKHHHHTNPV